MDIQELLDRASKLKIAIIGDMIEDNYILGDVDRISPEAPVVVVNKTEDRKRMGGAGNVFRNLEGLGINATLYCNFSEGKLWEGWHAVFANNYPHSKKTRIMSGQHHIIRIDEELKSDQIEWLPFTAFSWYKHLETVFGTYDAIVLSDYHKGVLSDSLINAVIELALHYNIPVIVDAKRDFERFKHATILKCNRKEYETYYKSQTTSENRGHLLPNALVDRLNLRHFIVTNGKSGISAYSTSDSSWGVDGIKMDVVDTCGAGDTVTAVLAMMCGLHESVYDGIKLANVAASQVCIHPGVYAIQKEDLLKFIKL